MKKTLLTERFQKLAGIKPLYGNLNEIGDEKLSPESSEWLKDQINMYFDGGDELEPGGRGEFEITRMEQGDPKKYQDAQSAQKFLDELKVIKSVVVRFDDYIGDILVLSDREGDALVSWTNPKDNQDLSEDYSEGNELKDMVMDMDKQEYGNFIRMNVDSEAERPWAYYNDEVKEFLSDLGDDKAAIMQQIKAIKTGQYR